jgi:hypothetical protein
MRLGAAVAAATLAACAGDSTAPRFVESSLVAAGRVLVTEGAPAEGALVHVQTLSSGKAGGEFGCTGSYLTGDWVALTNPDGRFTIPMGLRSDGTPVCIVVLALGAGDTAWRDTASVVRAFTPVATGVAPDTVHFDLRVLSPTSSATRGRQ